MGVQLAISPARRETRSARVEALIAEIPAVPVTASTARTHSRIDAALRSRGLPIVAHEHGHAVLTTNRRDFDRITGFAVVEPPP